MAGKLIGWLRSQNDTVQTVVVIGTLGLLVLAIVWILTSLA